MNGLEKHFVRQKGISEELQDLRIAGNEILDIGLGVARQQRQRLGRVLRATPEVLRYMKKKCGIRRPECLKNHFFPQILKDLTRYE